MLTFVLKEKYDWLGGDDFGELLMGLLVGLRQTRLYVAVAAEAERDEAAVAARPIRQIRVACDPIMLSKQKRTPNVVGMVTPKELLKILKEIE